MRSARVASGTGLKVATCVSSHTLIFLTESLAVPVEGGISLVTQGQYLPLSPALLPPCSGISLRLRRVSSADRPTRAPLKTVVLVVVQSGETGVVGRLWVPVRRLLRPVVHGTTSPVEVSPLVWVPRALVLGRPLTRRRLESEVVTVQRVRVRPATVAEIGQVLVAPVVVPCRL